MNGSDAFGVRLHDTDPFICKRMRTEGEMPLCLILIEDEDSNSGRQARTSVRLPLQPKRVLRPSKKSRICRDDSIIAH
jgi:hypothetical protein